MIVHPDFLLHRKTRLLVELTKDPAAPLMIIRLWAYCQVQRRFEFENLPEKLLAAVCESKLPGSKLLEILLESGFVKMEEKTLIVHDWDTHNRMLISAWNNGRFGGRPDKPTGNRPVSSRYPTANRTTRAREEKEDKIRVGYRPVSDRFSDQPGSGEEKKRGSRLRVLSEEEKNRNPANVQKFGALVGQLVQQLRSGEQSTPPPEANT